MWTSSGKGICPKVFPGVHLTHRGILSPSGFIREFARSFMGTVQKGRGSVQEFVRGHCGRSSGSLKTIQTHCIVPLSPTQQSGGKKIINSTFAFCICFYSSSCWSKFSVCIFLRDPARRLPKFNNVIIRLHRMHEMQTILTNARGVCLFVSLSQMHRITPARLHCRRRCTQYHVRGIIRYSLHQMPLASCYY